MTIVELNAVLPVAGPWKLDDEVLSDTSYDIGGEGDDLGGDCDQDALAAKSSTNLCELSQPCLRGFDPFLPKHISLSDVKNIGVNSATSLEDVDPLSSSSSRVTFSNQTLLLSYSVSMSEIDERRKYWRNLTLNLATKSFIIKYLGALVYTNDDYNLLVDDIYHSFLTVQREEADNFKELIELFYHDYSNLIAFKGFEDT